VPTVGAFGVRAAGEGGHALLKRAARRSANYQSVVGRSGEGYNEPGMWIGRCQSLAFGTGTRFLSNGGRVPHNPKR
jgi:hypothetical protein